MVIDVRSTDADLLGPWGPWELFGGERPAQEKGTYELLASPHII